MPQDVPQEAPGGPTMPQDSPRDVFLRGFLAGVQNHTCFYVSAVVSRRLTAPRYVFLRVFLASDRGPRRVEDAPGCLPDTCFYVFFLRVAEPPLSSYVFLRVGGSVDAVLTSLNATVISRVLVAFLHDHT